MPADSLEQMQATSYATGQQYKIHQDDDVDAGRSWRSCNESGDLPTAKCGDATRFDRLRRDAPTTETTYDHLRM